MSKFENIYLNGKDIIDIIYPIGCVYMSFDNTDPSTLYEGTTWEKIEGKTLVGVDINDDELNTSNLTGGEKTHVLTGVELPGHTHGVKIKRSSYEANGYGLVPPGTQSGFAGRPIVDSDTISIVSEVTGTNTPHNNMPPYITVFMWRRVS